MTHLDALNLRLSNERVRLANAKSKGESDLRTVWVAQLEKEIAGEQKHFCEPTMTDDELMAELLK